VFTGATTFRTLSTGGSGSSTDGLYMYGSSMALTNRALYFVKGNNYGASSLADPSVVHRDHWVYRVDNVTSTSSNAGLLASNAGGLGS
jgi:hypothetical protein